MSKHYTNLRKTLTEMGIKFVDTGGPTPNEVERICITGESGEGTAFLYFNIDAAGNETFAYQE